MGADDDETAKTAIRAHLRTLGAGAERWPVDATLVPSTEASALPAAESSVGPLPRIALSGDLDGLGKDARPHPEAADFEVLAMLGEGGMGRVHLARQRSLGREVAIKTLKTAAADARSTAMLRAEATTMGRLEHPNVVPVHSVGVDTQDRLVLVMKRIDGVSWRDLLRDPEHPRWQDLTRDRGARLEAHLTVLTQVANALHFAHEAGIVHRDVKPENVLLGGHGEVYLADWGIALRSTSGAAPTRELVGTPAYMAPEMVLGDATRIDRRTDVFLLGATLHEVLTGQPLHSGKNLEEALAAAARAEPVRHGPDVPAELSAIVVKATAKNPGDRYPTALAFREAIDGVRRHRGSIALTRSGQALLAQLIPGSLALDRQLTECRFALVQALREWPENAEARVALDACLRLAIGHELARENPAAAEALLGELSTDDPSLRAEARALATRVGKRKEEADRLHALEADQDATVGFRVRFVSVAAIVLIAGAISTYAVWRHTSSGTLFDPWEAVAASTLVLFATAVPMLVFRKGLLANAIGRRTSALLLTGTGGLVLHRTQAAIIGLPVSATLSLDLVIIAAVACAVGLLAPRAAWVAILPVVGGLMSALWPAYVLPIFSVSSLGTIAVAGVVWTWSWWGAQRKVMPPT